MQEELRGQVYSGKNSYFYMRVDGNGATIFTLKYSQVILLLMLTAN